MMAKSGPRESESEQAANVVGVAPLPAVRLEALVVMRVARVPGFVDAVEDAAEAALPRALGQEAMQAAAELRRGDFLRVGLADRGQMIGVVDARLEKREPAVEFDPVNLVGGFGNGQRLQARRIEGALIGEVVNGEQARRLDAAPGEIAGRERRRPVVEVQIVRPPVGIAQSRRHVGGRKAEAGEADVIVDPVSPVGVEIEPARPVIEVCVEDHVDGNAVGGSRSPQGAGWNFAEARQQADRLYAAGALEHLAIARHEDADVRQGTQRARQRRRDLAETAGLYVVGDFRSNEKDLAARNRRLSLRGLALKVAKTL
jgi:hypothetical protein